MSDSSPIQDVLAKITAKRQARRRFFSQAAVAGVAGLSVLGANPLAALAQTLPPNDNDIFNFALNLEYLEGEFYARATTGQGLPDSITTGTGTRGEVVGGRQVTFTSDAVRQYANEIASDEMAHVRFFRSALGAAAIARPAINLRESFMAAATAAGLPSNFDPFADENSFLLGAFIFEDVGVTAFKGAAPLINDRRNLENAAGVLAVEAYHAGLIRTVLFARGLGRATNQISDARDSLDGTTDDDQGILNADGTANIVPTDANSIVYSRTAGQVLNVVYLTPTATTRGGFFPNGVNGTINTSAANG
jgi:hypothetical protein